MAEAKVCEACGDSCGPNDGLECKPYSDHPRDLLGAFICFKCRGPTYIGGDEQWELIYSRIRLRRSAPQPPKSAEFKVGDRVRIKSSTYSPHVGRECVVTGIGEWGREDEVCLDGTWFYLMRSIEPVTHLHHEAATGAPEKTPGEAVMSGRRSGKMRALLVTPNGNERLVPASECLAEVERQAALVARLDFDLKMLKLLGQGWSRGDLQARLARPASELERGRE